MTQEASASPGAGRYGRWLFAAGALLSLISAVYLVLYAWRHWEQLPPLRLSWNDGAWLVGAGMLYFSSLITTAAAWFYAVRALGGTMSAGSAGGVALTSQLGKYAPGNVAHHLGRAALASNRGLSLGLIAKASLMEIATVVLASGLVAGVTVLLVPETLDTFSSMGLDVRSNAILLAVVVVALAVGALGLATWLRRARDQLSLRRSDLLAGGVRMLACYCLGFLFAGLSYYAVARGFGQTVGVAPCIALYALAWVVGFITPGAPAGLGVRESILVVALTGSMGPAAISVAVAHRLITAIADAAGGGVGALALSATRSPRTPGAAVHE